MPSVKLGRSLKKWSTSLQSRKTQVLRVYPSKNSWIITFHLKWLKTFNMWVWLFKRLCAANLPPHTLRSTRLQRTYNSESITLRKTTLSCLTLRPWGIVRLNGSALWRCSLRDSTRRTLYHWRQTARSATPTVGSPSMAVLVPVSEELSQKLTCGCS